MSAMDFDELLEQARNALDAIAKGDPTGYQELYSDDDDITLGNPFGGFGKGRAAVFEQLERAASYYRDGRATLVRARGAGRRPRHRLHRRDRALRGQGRRATRTSASLRSE